MWSDKPVSKITEEQMSESTETADVSDAARLFAKFLRSTGAPDKVANFTSKSNGVFKGQSAKFDYYVDLNKKTVASRQRNTFDTSVYVWDDKTQSVKIAENKIALSESAPPDAKIERWIKANKQHFKDQYGDKKGTELLYAKAWKMYNEK